MCCEFILDAFSETFFATKIRPVLFSPASDRWLGAAINAMLIRLCWDVPVSGAPFVYRKGCIWMADDDWPRSVAG